MDLTKMSVVELKMLAYDQIVLRDSYIKNIQMIQQEIERKGIVEKEEPKKK